MCPHWCGNWITTCCRRQLRRRDLVGWPRRDSPVLRKVKGSGSCTSARVGHPAGVAGRGNKRCAAGKPSRAIVRAAGEFSGSLTGGPRAPHLEASVIHGGLLCIYLEVRPVAHRLTPAPRPQFHAHPSLRGGEMTVEGSVFTGSLAEFTTVIFTGSV